MYINVVSRQDGSNVQTKKYPQYLYVYSTNLSGCPIANGNQEQYINNNILVTIYYQDKCQHEILISLHICTLIIRVRFATNLLQCRTFYLVKRTAPLQKDPGGPKLMWNLK